VPLKYLIDDARRNNTLAMARKLMDQPNRYGTVIGSNHGWVEEFKEKVLGAEAGFINGGIYVAKSTLLADRPIVRCSMEMDIFPGLLAQKRLRWMPFAEPFIDIGIPED
jgi:NDP-sugar pyrophosphorylase family protein